jgi:AcrR family transcriptional regulator
MQTLVAAPELSGDHEVRERLRDAAIQQFGRHGFGTALSAIAEAADASAALLLQEFGSSEGLRRACDDHILETIRTAKSDSLQSMSPTTWFAQLAQIESYAPIMHYLVRSMLSGGELGRALMDRMIENAEGYLEDAVRAGSIRPSRDPKARAAFLAMTGGGGFLLYLHMHDNPSDMAAVLRDYSKDMVLPALEVYAHGLMTDSNV